MAVKSNQELLDMVSAKMTALRAIQAQRDRGAYQPLEMPKDWNTWGQDRRTRWLTYFNAAFDEEMAKR